MSSPITTLIFFFFQALLIAQPASLLTTAIDSSISHIEVNTDWKAIRKHRKAKYYAPSNVVLINKSGQGIVLSAEVRLRGHMRMENCEIPPLKIKFNKDELAFHGFSLLNEWKIVLPCERASDYHQFLLKEYLAYKIWELLSPHALRTHLTEVHLVNGSKSQTMTGFILEDAEEIADRLHANEYKAMKVHVRTLDEQQFLTMCLFQFMIGNTDWFVSNQHNIIFLGSTDKVSLTPVPYDFDYAGLVDSPYAVHHKTIDLSSVTLRYYQGNCHSEEDVMKVLDVFFKRKEEILALPWNIPGLTDRSRKEATKYLEEFYEIVEDPGKLKNQILKACGQWPVKD